MIREHQADQRPSVVLLSPTNEVLLLHRVQASNSFPSAHVFPGGHISSFHEPDFPPSTLSVDNPEYHQDSLPYRLAAIRETFEESGILLARSKEEPRARTTEADANNAPPPLLTLPQDIATTFRTAVHGETVKFTEFLKKRGARPCTDELVPFTRWITPAWNKGRRFTTQMYLFLMPLANTPSQNNTSSSLSSPSADSPSSPLPPDNVLENIITPTSDGGIEHTAATFATPADWLQQQTDGHIILFPPQCFLLTLIARVFEAVSVTSSSPPSPSPPLSSRQELYAAQRKALLEFVHKPTATPLDPSRTGLPAAGEFITQNVHPTAMIPWTEKVMSPEPLFTRESDGRLVLGVDKPGLELKGSGRGGDFERVVLVHFRKEGPRNVEVRQRADVLREEKEGTSTKTKSSRL